MKIIKNEQNYKFNYVVFIVMKINKYLMLLIIRWLFVPAAQVAGQQHVSARGWRRLPLAACGVPLVRDVGHIEALQVVELPVNLGNPRLHNIAVAPAVPP